MPILAATRRAIGAEPWHGKTWNQNILAIEKRIKEIEVDQNPVPMLSIEGFIGKKGQS